MKKLIAPVPLILLAVLLVMVASCRQRKATPAPPIRPVVEAKVPPVSFRDVTKEAGIDFVQVNGAQGKKWMPETMGGGVAVFDYNNDGREDILFVSSCYWPGDPRAKTLKSSLTLYENIGNGPDGVPRFKDVTKEAGLDKVLYGMGAAVGDYDNDGWEDIYVTGLGAYGGNRLFHNDHGHFVDVTRQAGVGDAGWGTSAAFFDYDGDGRLDLFLGRYVHWTPGGDLFCSLDGTHKSYCTPERYPGTSPRLFHNDGNGHFTDVTKKAGMDNANAKALGVVPLDFNNDGKIDLAVSNDTAPNNLYRNNGDGTFADVGLEEGVGVDESGKSRGAMGIDAAHIFSGTGLSIGNFSNEMKSFYWTDDGTVFLDRSAASGIGRDSLLDLTFGLFFFDYDLDGRPDLFFANGHVESSVQEVESTVSYREPPTLYWNAGGGKFSNATKVAGLNIPMVARGAAFGDLNGDGKLDIVVAENGGPAHLFLNSGNTPNKGVRITFEGTGRSNRDAVGTKVFATIAGHTEEQMVHMARSYLSSSEKTVTFGLGTAPRVDLLSVTWPDGSKAESHNIVPGLYHWTEGEAIRR